MFKIIEKTILIQTQKDLDNNDLLYKYQSGFSANVSTDSSLVQFRGFILRGMGMTMRGMDMRGLKEWS